jgi:hypothetical protein
MKNRKFIYEKMVLITEPLFQLSVIFIIKLKYLKISVHQSIQNSSNVNIVSRPSNKSSCFSIMNNEASEDFSLRSSLLDLLQPENRGITFLRSVR